MGGAYGHGQARDLFIGLSVIVGSIYYFAVYNRKPIEVLKEHAAEVPDFDGAALGEMAP